MSQHDVFGDLVERLNVGEESKQANPLVMIVADLFVLFVASQVMLLIDAWTFMVLWNWFAPSLGFVSLSYPLSLGVMWTIGFLKARWSQPDDSEDSSRTKKVLESPIAYLTSYYISRLLYVGFALGGGYLITLFM